METIIVREVFGNQLEDELCFIRGVLRRYPVVSFDTEFPGTLFQLGKDQPPYSSLSCQAKYSLMKSNIDALKIIQLGLSLSDWQGNLPSSNNHSGQRYVWQFNFRDFDLDKDSFNSDSIRLLKDQGIDFEKNKKDGISSQDFKRFLFESGLMNNNPASMVTWITFQGSYDFALMIKILTGGQDLPDDLESFMAMVRSFFGLKIFDVKHLMKFCNGLFGGLEKLSQTLEVPRVAGKSHQAGSDSLLTLQTFFKLVQMFFVDDSGRPSIPGMSIIHGFEHVRPLPPLVATRRLFPTQRQQPFIQLPPPRPVMVRRVYPVVQPMMFPCGGRVVPVAQPVMFPRGGRVVPVRQPAMMCNPNVTMVS